MLGTNISQYGRYQRENYFSLVFILFYYWLIMFPKQDLINKTWYFMSFCILRKRIFKLCLNMYAGKQDKINFSNVHVCQWRPYTFDENRKIHLKSITLKHTHLLASTGKERNLLPGVVIYCFSDGFKPFVSFCGWTANIIYSLWLNISTKNCFGTSDQRIIVVYNYSFHCWYLFYVDPI